MNKRTLEILGYKNIKEELSLRTSSNLGKILIEEMLPKVDENIIIRMQNETKEGRKILDDSGNIPLFAIRDVTFLYNKLSSGGILSAEELKNFEDFFRSIRLFKNFMKKHEYNAEILFGYSTYLEDYKDIENEIEYCIDGSYVLDRSSSNLKNIRRNIKINEEKIISKINKFLNSSENKKIVQDSYYSVKNGRYVIPIKNEYKGKVNGTVVEVSSSGATVYVELENVKKISLEIDELKLVEENKIYQILATLSGLIYERLESVKVSMDIMGQMDFIFARSKYSIDLGGTIAKKGRTIKLFRARHPELGEECVPIDFEVEDKIRTVVITGPNTGGKTVSLKTIGLLVLLNQSGIQIPADDGSELPIFKKILVDIGDLQDIKQSLSTFSGHMKNIDMILKNSTKETLVLIDEIGTGTDPKDGASIGIAILEFLNRAGAFTVVSTHYGEIKDYSNCNESFINASMTFNPNTLEPLYRLIIGKSGESNAYWILENIGVDKKILKRAKEISKHGFLKDEIIYHKKVNNQNRKNKINENKINESKENFQKGDRVLILRSGKEGIVYDYDDFEKKVKVFVNKEYLKFDKKQLKILFKYNVLYPVGYDMEQLFVSFKERKLRKDIGKGRINKLKEINKKL